MTVYDTNGSKRNNRARWQGVDPVIEARRQQLHFGEGLIAEEVSDLREDWMKQADRVLEDQQLVATVYEALTRRRPKSRTRGRKGTPAEVVLRLLLLKHIRNWSYQVLEREVRANLVYRDFTRVGAWKVPDARRWGAGDWRCNRKKWKRFMPASSRSPKKTKW